MHRAAAFGNRGKVQIPWSFERLIRNGFGWFWSIVCGYVNFLFLFLLPFADQEEEDDDKNDASCCKKPRGWKEG